MWWLCILLVASGTSYYALEETRIRSIDSTLVYKKNY